MKIRLVWASACAVLALSTSVTSSLAQTPKSAPKASAPSAPAAPTTVIATGDYVEQRVDGDQVVTFPGDALQGDENSAYGFTVRRPPGVLRAGLIRPRVNFVSELLKSVESL